MVAIEILQHRNEPKFRKGMEHVDGDVVRLSSPGGAGGAGFDQFQCLAQVLEVGGTNGCQSQLAWRTFEERRAQKDLQRLDLMADRRGREQQFLGGDLHRSVPCRGLEGADGSEWREIAFHGGTPRRRYLGHSVRMTLSL